MRVAMIGQRGVPATFGGIEHHVEELGARLAARGHEVTIWCRRNYTTARASSYRGMHLRYLPTVPTKHLDALVHSGLASAATLGRPPDLVHFHAVGPGVWSPLPRYFSGSKVVQTVHGLDDERAKWNSGAQLLLRGARWTGARSADHLIAVSRDLVRRYEWAYGRTPDYIPNGATPPTAVEPGPALARFGLRPRHYVLFVGRLVPEKAPDVLVRAFHGLEGDMQLVVVGGTSFTDAYVASLKRLAAADPRVRLTGFLDRPTLDELYTHAAAFVLPSTLEGLPLTLLEAAAAGAPIVASAIGPHVEILGPDRAGSRLVEPGSDNSLATTLRQVLDNADSERAGSRAYRSSVMRRYDWDASTEATEALYKRTLADCRRHEPVGAG